MARICQRCQHHNEDHAKFCLSCGAMLDVEVADAGDPLIGKVLVGRYRPTRLLGEGGMGRVYLAEQKMGAAVRRVAIKTLHPELSQDPQIVARFHRESETVIELSHPNTIQFYDFGELEDGTLFIVMEYIEGRALASEMEKGRLEVPRIDKILIQICGSLHEAHGRGIVHRDLKPDNVLLTDRGGQTDFVKVLDFGIAKKGEADDPAKQRLTKQGMVLGTPPYMSPEQFSGKLLDARSDIYSLGVMVYEMLTGVLPFDAKTPWEWATKHLTAQPAPFESHPGSERIAPNKKAAVMRALSKDREQRQAQILDFLQEFTGYQDAQAAWTMATSSGNVPVQNVARPPVMTPTPFGGTSPLPSVSASSQPGFGGPTPAPSYPGNAGYASNPSYPGAVPSVPGNLSGTGPAYSPYATGTMEAPRGGNIGKIVIALVLALFVIGGGVGGTLFYLFLVQPGQLASNGTQGQTSGNGPVGNGPSGNGPSGNGPSGNGPHTMQPMMQPVDAGTGAGTVVTPEEPRGVDAGTAVAIAEDEDEPGPSTKRGPSAAEEARARGLVTQGQSAISRNDFRAAIGALREAQRLVGRRSRATDPLQDELDRRGGNQILSFLQQGRCPQAQQLFRDLRGVGATGGARYFDPSWCARP